MHLAALDCVSGRYNSPQRRFQANSFAQLPRNQEFFWVKEPDSDISIESRLKLLENGKKRVRRQRWWIGRPKASLVATRRDFFVSESMTRLDPEHTLCGWSSHLDIDAIGASSFEFRTRPGKETIGKKEGSQ